MHLASITLRDWKAFEVARFEFPPPSASKNVVLIGGRNGFGKTSLFEALAIGLFGRDGLRLVNRAGSASDEQARTQSFREFMERALFSGALSQGRRSCKISLEFLDESGEPISIERTWYFSDAGRLKAGEGAEQVRILAGVSRKAIGPGRSEQDPDGWYRDWIARTFLPTSLAGFFLFDGESASIYADRDMGVQVRDGIEGLLGLNWLRQLAKDLRVYAGHKRLQIPRGVSTEAIDELEASIGEMEAEIDAAQRLKDQLEEEWRQSDSERDNLTRELSGYGTGTRAQLEDLVKDQAAFQRQYDDAQSKLHEIADMDLPLALVGAQLRQAVEMRLVQERRRDSWEAAAAQREERTSDVLCLFSEQVQAVAPPLLPEQEDFVRRAVQLALERLWFPPPTDVAEDYRHPHARGPMLERVSDRLKKAELVSASTIKELLDAMGRNAARLRDLQSAIRATEVTAPQLEEKRSRISELSSKVGELREKKGEISNLLKSRLDELEQKRRELGRLTGRLDQSQRPAQLASRAEQVAEMLGDLVMEAWPLQASAVAEEMTRAIRAMAHRNDYLRTVEIDEAGEVKLLSPKGDDLRQYDLSAGEKQVFTQALFSAIAEVSGRTFPLVVDTPLGRLDEAHRVNVLRHLAKRRGQVILISTDTEVVGPYLNAVRGRIGKALIIRNSTESGVGRSWPEDGYFDGQEVN